MDVQDIEQRFQDALRQFGLLKEAATVVDVEEDVGVTRVQEEDVPEAAEPRTEESPLPKPTLSNLFRHPDAHPYVLDLALLKKYGPEWMEWDQETLLFQVPQDFPTPSISDLNMAKLEAVKALHMADGFWDYWEVFVPVTMALNAVFPDFEVAQVPTVAQCAVAIDTADRIRGRQRWSDEMLTFLEVVHLHDGIVCPIEPLSFVEVDTEEYPVDCSEVTARWPMVRRTRKKPTGDSAVDEQLRRLLIIQEAIDETHAQLSSQLPLLLV